MDCKCRKAGSSIGIHGFTDPMLIVCPCKRKIALHATAKLDCKFVTSLWCAGT